MNDVAVRSKLEASAEKLERYVWAHQQSSQNHPDNIYSIVRQVDGKTETFDLRCSDLLRVAAAVQHAAPPAPSADSEECSVRRDDEPALQVLDQITIPLPVVPHGPANMSREEGTSRYLHELAKKITRGSVVVGGSNVTATVHKLLMDAAVATRFGVHRHAPSADREKLADAAGNEAQKCLRCENYAVECCGAIERAHSRPIGQVDEAELAQVIQNAQDGDLCKNGWSRKPGLGQRRAAQAVCEYLDSLRGEGQ